MECSCILCQSTRDSSRLSQPLDSSRCMQCLLLVSAWLSSVGSLAGFLFFFYILPKKAFLCTRLAHLDAVTLLNVDKCGVGAAACLVLGCVGSAQIQIEANNS